MTLIGPVGDNMDPTAFSAWLRTSIIDVAPTGKIPALKYLAGVHPPMVRSIIRTISICTSRRRLPILSVRASARLALAITSMPKTMCRRVITTCRCFAWRASWSSPVRIACRWCFICATRFPTRNVYLTWMPSASCARWAYRWRGACSIALTRSVLRWNAFATWAAISPMAERLRSNVIPRFSRPLQQRLSNVCFLRPTAPIWHPSPFVALNASP